LRRTVFVAAVFSVLVTVPSVAAPVIGECSVFPPDNVWNARVDQMPVDPRSDDFVASIGADASPKPDFAAAKDDNGGPIGIPFGVVPMKQKKVAITFEPYDGEDAVAEESDAGPAPIPADAIVEGGPKGDGDRHVLIVQQGSCTLFELYRAVRNKDGSWNGGSFARFDLGSNELRIDGWTSTDAAGLPIFPGLVRYEEVAAGKIEHALRFTAPRTSNRYVWPARHFASSDDNPALPPMGQRFRLKQDVDISGFSPQTQVVLAALKAYGMILADNGSPWFISGAPNAGWDDEALQSEFRKLKGTDFEAVDESSLQVGPDSAAVGGS
jgi:hypothetical protein